MTQAFSSFDDECVVAYSNVSDIDQSEVRLATRRSEFDVTDRVNTTDPSAVEQEVIRIYQKLYSAQSAPLITRGFADCVRLYRGADARYYACDTAYHNMQHVLEVTLAMARLMDGYEQSRRFAEPLPAELFELGILTALFHDIGYLRHRKDTRHRNGAEYTLHHVSRGAYFLDEYMQDLGVPQWSRVAGRIIHFTGYEIPAQRIDVPSPLYRLLGNMLGSADIVAQMADRCYLEKCRDRLFPEFVWGGLASAQGSAPRKPTALFSSPQDLLHKTPGFYRTATGRLVDHLGAVFRYAETHFGGDNLYLEELSKNIRYAERIAEARDTASLRRIPPPKHGVSTSMPTSHAGNPAAVLRDSLGDPGGRLQGKM
jgi:HD domain-containing protein